MIGWLKKFRERRATKTTLGHPQSAEYWVKKLFGRSSLTTATGIIVDHETALKFSAVWAAINIISRAVGFLPLITYKRLTPKGKDRAQDHYIYKLLHDRPNRFMSAMVFRETLQGHVLALGNAYAEIERDGAGRPIALWPLRPDRTEPKIIDDELVYEIREDTGGPIRLHYENVLHIPGLGFDGLKGYSVIEYMAENVALGLAAEQNAAAFFGNDSSPTGYLYIDKPINAETKKQIEKNWEEKHKGLDKKYRIAVLHSGLDWKQIGIPAKDSQLLESRRFSVSDVARWFSIPPHMLADLEKATFSNIEHQAIEFVVWTLQAWLTKWEQECNYKLFPTEDNIHFVEFLVSALMRGDTKSRYEAYQIGRQQSFLSPNEIREFENLNPYEGGDTYLEPLNMQPVGFRSRDRALLCDAWRRIMTKEVNAMRKIMDGNGDGLQKAAEFYENHSRYIVQMLDPILRLTPAFSEQAAKEHCEKRLAELKKTEKQNLSGLFDRWSNSLPVELAERFVKGE